VILVDLNVLLDVLQTRQPHYQASATLVDRVISGDTRALIAAHAVTTIHYLVSRHRNSRAADDAADSLLRHFDIVTVGRQQMLRARTLGWPDFEDAVVAASAEAAGCVAIISRNIKDFRRSAIPALTPEGFLASRELPR